MHQVSDYYEQHEGLGHLDAEPCQRCGGPAADGELCSRCASPDELEPGDWLGEMPDGDLPF